MLLITCPHCGPARKRVFLWRRAHIARPLAENSLTDAEFADYLFLRDNPKGMFLERWRHVAGCRRWFNMARDTVTHEIVEIYPMGSTRRARPARRHMPTAGAGTRRRGRAKPASKSRSKQGG